MLDHSVYVLYLFLFGCASHQGTTTTTTTITTTPQPDKYSEDLSIWRPTIEVESTDVPPEKNGVERKSSTYVEPKYNINIQLDAVLDSIDQINLSRKYIDGFSIQIYSGSKREDALNIKKQVTSSFPSLDSEVQYVQPNFRVKTGRYYQRIEAQRDYLAIKRQFPNAIVIPDKVAIN